MRKNRIIPICTLAVYLDVKTQQIICEEEAGKRDRKGVGYSYLEAVSDFVKNLASETPSVTDLSHMTSIQDVEREANG